MDLIIGTYGYLLLLVLQLLPLCLCMPLDGKRGLSSEENLKIWRQAYERPLIETAPLASAEDWPLPNSLGEVGVTVIVVSPCEPDDDGGAYSRTSRTGHSSRSHSSRGRSRRGSRRRSRGSERSHTGRRRSDESSSRPPFDCFTVKRRVIPVKEDDTAWWEEEALGPLLLILQQLAEHYGVSAEQDH